MLLIFYVFYFVGWTLALPVLALLSQFVIKKWKSSLKQKLTIFDKDFFYIYDNSKPVWFHAVSVGEFNALLPVLDHFTGISTIISVTTQTAYELACMKLKDKIEKNQIKIFYMPFDHPLLVRRIFKLVHPQALVLLESEIWPALFAEAQNAGVKLAIINAKLSDKSFKAYDALSVFFRPILNMVDVFLVQSAEYSRKLLRLGVKKDKVFVLGNIKFSSLPKFDNFSVSEFKAKLGYKANDLLIVCASTHEEEEATLVSAFQEIKQNFDNIRLIIAPRHPERFHTVKDIVNCAAKLIPHFYTDGEALDSVDDVLIVNTIGDLLKFYAIADIAFMGGTLNEKVGGHNILEPAFFAKPIISGPHYHKNTQIYEMMIEAQGLIVIDTKIELKAELESLIISEDKRKILGICAQKLTQANSKIVYNLATKLKEYIS
jgi:3-deoxy-D-manno-octulosonic-acid transferase